MSLYPNDDGAYAGAKKLLRALGGHWHGGYGMARCPAHDDTSPSLSVTQKNGRVLVCCHAGCSQRDVISAFDSLGLRLSHVRVSRDTDSSIEEDEERTRNALAIFEEAVRADGTLVETYLASRGLHAPPPNVLRFHNGLKHRSGGICPAMVAQVTRGHDGVPLAIHRTFLARDGAGKAPLEPSKMMLGPCRGGAVRLADPGDTLMVGEGIETCLAAMLATGHPAWAALSTTGLRTLDLPDDVRKVIVLADGDDAGEGAATHAASRWRRQGRRVHIARPPRGFDFNDVLCGNTR
jgi:putative DNA primase/helicase